MCNILVWHKGVFQLLVIVCVSISFSLYIRHGLTYQIIIKNSPNTLTGTLSIRLEMINVDPDNVSFHTTAHIKIGKPN